jgi:hypothetical protein
MPHDPARVAETKSCALAVAREVVEAMLARLPAEIRS